MELPCCRSCSVGRKNSAMLSRSRLNPLFKQVFKTVLKSGLDKIRSIFLFRFPVDKENKLNNYVVTFQNQ